MALSFAHGAIQWSTSNTVGTTKTVSGLTFQPKALRFYSLGGVGNLTDSASASADADKFVGFAVSTSSRRCAAATSEDAAGNANCGSAVYDNCVAAVLNGNVTDGLLDLNSITSDGFVLIVDDQLAIDNALVFWEAWGGSDITVAVVGDITEPAATGDVDYTVTGFTSAATDQVVMLAGAQSTSALNTAENQDSGFHVGFAASTTAADNVTVCGNSDDGSATMETNGYCQDSECLSMITIAGGNPNARATLTAFGTDNFRLNWAARATTGRRSIFLAIKGGSWKSGALTIDGNTGSATATVSGLAFAPVGVSLAGRMTAENTSATSTADDRMSLGTGTSTSSRRSMGMLDTNGVGAAEINTVQEYDQVLAYPSTTGTLQAAYDINAMNSDGFQLIVDTAGGVASEFIGYLTFGSAAVATTKIYLRNTQANNIGATYYDMLTTAGSSADTGVVASTAAGTEIQLTKTSGGALVNFVTPPLSAGFTLTTADVSIWAKEDNALTNVGGRARFFRREADGTETELAGGPFDDGVEFTTSDAEYTWTANFTDTAFIAGDRLLLKLYITNIGVMVVGDATFTFNAADAATGDAFITVTPAITFSAEDVLMAQACL